MHLLDSIAHSRHRLTLAVLGIFMTAMLLSGFSTAANTVTIYDGDTITTVRTTETDAASILAEQEITLTENDEVVFTGLENQTGTITVLRAFRVLVTADNITHDLQMTKGTVADALELAGVTVSDDDLINAALTEYVHDGTDILVNRVTYKETVATENLPFSVVEQEDANLESGVREVVTEGSTGIRTCVYRTMLIDGTTYRTDLVSDTVTTQPVDEVVSVGTKVETVVETVSTTATTVSQEVTEDAEVVEYTNYTYLGRFKITGYCSCAKCCGSSTGLTASGATVQEGVTIAAPSRFAFGTQLMFNNHVYTVQDRGSAITGNVIDLYFASHSAALQWGVRYFDVYLVS